jgi:hypothetical protein
MTPPSITKSKTHFVPACVMASTVTPVKLMLSAERSSPGNGRVVDLALRCWVFILSPLALMGYVLVHYRISQKR